MRFLSISIGEEIMGIELERVREVIAFPEISPLPGSPNFCLGIINLRDHIIPVIDLRLKFSVTPTLTQDTVVVICNIEDKTLGVVVDAIHSVNAPPDEDIMQMTQMSSKLVHKVVLINKKLCLVLDINNVLGASQREVQELDVALSNMKSAA